MLIPAASPTSPYALSQTPQVSDFGLSDDKTITRVVEGVVNPLVTAKLFVKTNLSDADVSAVISKSISTALTSAGQITDTGAVDGVGAVSFELAQADTAQLVGTKYYYIEVIDSAGNLYILERGIMLAAIPIADPNIRKRPLNWNLSAVSVEPPAGGTRLVPSELIDDLDQGEVYSFTRKIQGTLPGGWSITNLVFTVRRSGTDLDGAALVQKTVAVGTIGTDATYPVTVSFTTTDTAKFIGAVVWDAKLAITNGALTKKYTVAIGTLNARGAVPAVGTILPAVYTMAIATPPTITAIPVQLVLTMADVSSVPINPNTRDVRWGSQNKAVVFVSPTGLVSAVAAGTADIVAICEGVEVRATVTVQAPVFSVTVTPSPLTVNVGAGASALTVVLRDAASNVLTGRTIAYVSSNPAAATVDGNGNVTAVASGTTTITVTSEGIVQTVSVTASSLSAVFRYAVGDSLAAYTCTRSSTGYQFDTAGTISSVAVNTARDAHYLGTQRTLLLEPTSTNRATQTKDLSQAVWTKSPSGVLTSQVADPFGTSLAAVLNDTSAAAFQYAFESVSIAVSGAQSVSVLVARGPSNPKIALVHLNDTAAPASRMLLYIDWTAPTPSVSHTADNGVAVYAKQVGSGSLWWIVGTCNSTVSGNTHTVEAYPGADRALGAAALGDIVIAHVQVENGAVATSPILSGSSQVSRSGDTLSRSVPGGAGQNGTLYEKYIDLATGALVEQVSALTTSSTFAPATGRAWIGWKFALGTQTLSTMIVL